jgi:hypothetical protein
MLVGEEALTADKALMLGWGKKLGLLTFDQVVPFQCRIRVCAWVLPVVYPPTAQALVGEVVVTALRPLLAWATLGLGTRAHAVPSQCRVKVRSWVPTQ